MVRRGHSAHGKSKVSRAIDFTIERLEERINFGQTTYPFPPTYCTIGLLGAGGPTGGVPVQTLSTGGVENIPTFSPYPVRYFDGKIKLNATDLTSDAFGSTLSISRSWTNGITYRDESALTTGVGSQLTGQNWYFATEPELLNGEGEVYGLVMAQSATDARFFNNSGSGDKPALYGAPEYLSQSGVNNYNVVDSSGDIFHYTDYDNSEGTSDGQLRTITDPSGNVTTYTYDDVSRLQEISRDESIGGHTITDSFVFAYTHNEDDEDWYPYSPDTFQVHSITLQRETDGDYEDADVVRKVVYDYYGESDDHGTATSDGLGAADLKTATVEDADNNVISTQYYRYYTSNVYVAGHDNDPDYLLGYAGGLKYVVGSASYDRLQAALPYMSGSPTSVEDLTDAQLRTYADNYFEYDKYKPESLQRLLKMPVAAVVPAGKEPLLTNISGMSTSGRLRVTGMMAMTSTFGNIRPLKR